MKTFVTTRIENTNDKSKELFKNTSEKYHNLLILRHLKSDKIAVVEEVLEFTVESLISDIGGLTGIFLGISFWSLFDSVFDVLISKIVFWKV